MRKYISILFLVFLAVILLVAPNPVSAEKPISQPAFVHEYLGQTDFIEGRLSQLLGAMTQDQMSWAPADGIRNCGQIYLHVTEANHMLAGFMKGEEMKGERGAMEKSITDKDEILKAMKKSFDAVRDAAGNLTEEELNKMVQTPFGMEMSMRNFMITLLSHSHEHLGQGIAYARMNGVAPPWSKEDSEG
ncbi:MAG: DinB family protein [Ignavibacteriaceae bacterium]|nr:DinB family protein [Ignavibacteria bacterium]MBT8391521.1 DinB family protein [Ignavibacteria bacterium]NNL22689.1 DinB family protein [Ignavibacteriaceae bacterium]